jgi:alkanesulfonate monooxygenase SsuD/methylene tetrahydromethanopterin reductase-like flavin-dependent oxidoreductase (luciferase family)
MNKIKIGILDFGHRDSKNGLEKINDVIEDAVLADKLGFSRYWLSEHHNFILDAAWSNPEVILPIICGMTERIKIGLAGVLINIHSPYRVALNFKLLSNLFPDRIDLGIAKGAPDNNKISYLSNPDFKNSNQICEYTEQLVNYFYKEEELLNDNIIIPPYGGDIPALWTLSLSNNGTKQALSYKTNFSRSLFHKGSNIEYDRETIDTFKIDYFKKYNSEPLVNIAFACYCDESNKIAEKKYLDIQKNADDIKSTNAIVGCPQKIFDTLSLYQKNYNVDEFICLDISGDNIHRKKSMEMLATIFEL